MRDMAHSICLVQLYQIMMRKNFNFLFLTTLKLFLKEIESLRRSPPSKDPHMIVKNTAILQENGVFRLHQVAPSMPSQTLRQRELKDKEIALLANRSTPLSNGCSPRGAGEHMIFSDRGVPP